MSVFPSACPHGTTRFPLVGFREVWYLSFFFRKLVEKIKVSFNSDKNDGYFTWRPVHIFDHMLTHFLKWEVFQTKVAEKNKTHVLRSVTFFFNRSVYEIMWKDTVQPGRPQVTIWRMRIACWITKARNAHPEYVLLTAFPLQQQLHERASTLHSTYIACLVICNLTGLQSLEWKVHRLYQLQPKKTTLTTKTSTNHRLEKAVVNTVPLTRSFTAVWPHRYFGYGGDGASPASSRDFHCTEE